MTEATGVSFRKLCTEGEETLYEITCTSADSTNTLTIPTSGNGEEITTSSLIKIVSVNNTTLGTCLGTITCTYTAATRLFTPTEAGASADVYKIEFRVVNL